MADADVLVVGGGPAGSSIAHALASRGIDVMVVDRARFPRPKPCAEYLSPQASRSLARMGALDEVERSGAAALAGIRVYAPNGSVIAGDFVAKHGYHGFRDRGLSVRREVLDAILLERAGASGARIVEGAKVTELLREPDGRVRGVRLTLDDSSREVRARVVVGADGLGSVVARRLGLTRRLRWPRRIALVTHYKGVKDVGEHGEMHVAPDGYVGIADVGGGLTTVAAVFPVSRSREISRDRIEFLRRWLFDQRRLALRFASAERVTPVVATGPFASYARRASAPGAALVGDAADFFDPFTGEGIYAALRGGEILADHVTESLAAATPALADAALREYDYARRREFGGKWLVERVIGAVVASPRLINRAARRLAARKDLADLLIGVTGNFVPAREVIRLGYVWNVFISGVP
ncbi:MAG TPA: NAD(P)/FAD-dependent oxidoreductase [Gemmatimonadaceae bacterium]|jgi:flavin-dependent dehydrogenase|nr:NAD(P)/FAD-dependent oxidoreductase [Gemmatimonadaceae bacterium]